ncbi:MAG: NAD-dependent epimerase/dehydratase family protein, partial [Anaerolineae bacterium]|nr:NAD-dependent epimerase/dehydratase family protein [Anaerolineae bacterium]
MQLEHAIVLVTGAAGFLGSSISERLLADPSVEEVVGLDAFLDYYPRDRKEANLAPLRADRRFRFVEANLLDADLPALLGAVDGVFHQAAQAGVRASWGASFAIYTDCNILATQRLLEACRAARTRVVYASSSSIYGETRKIPMHEDDLPQPVSPYGVSKLAAEHLCVLYTKNFGVPTVSLRYFTVYGPRQRPDMAFHKFIRAAIEGRPIEIYGDGEQTRDFTFVSDAVDANLAAMERGRPGAVYNIGGGSRVSVNEVLATLGELLGRPLDIRNMARAQGDVTHTYADTTRARGEIGFAPRVA